MILAKGSVRVGDIEQVVHFTPTINALQGIASVIAGSPVATLNFLAGLAYWVNYGGVDYASDYVFFQTTNPSQSGYIYGWQWVTLTGLTGYIGSAVGFAFSGMFTSTMTGTLNNFQLVGACYQTTDEYGNPVIVCPSLFTVGLSMNVSAGSTVKFSSTIVVGISGWSVISSQYYWGTISTIIPNADFLRNIAMLFLPKPVASLANATPRGYISTINIGGYTAGVNVSLGTAQVTFYGSVYVDQDTDVGTIYWTGRDTLYITYPSPSTLYLYNTLAVVLSTLMALQPGEIMHRFTLLISFVS